MSALSLRKCSRALSVTVIGLAGSAGAPEDKHTGVSFARDLRYPLVAEAYHLQQQRLRSCSPSFCGLWDFWWLEACLAVCKVVHRSVPGFDSSLEALSPCSRARRSLFHLTPHGRLHACWWQQTPHAMCTSHETVSRLGVVRADLEGCGKTGPRGSASANFRKRPQWPGWPGTRSAMLAPTSRPQPWHTDKAREGWLC